MKKIVKVRMIAFCVLLSLLCGGLSPALKAKAYSKFGDLQEANKELEEIAGERYIQALVYLQDYYEVKENPDAASKTVIRVPSGQTVEIEGVSARGDEIWMKVSLANDDQIYTGYICRSNLACSDERFLEWEKRYQLAQEKTIYDENGVVSDVNIEDILQFPESYQKSLRALKEQHPTWIFVPMNTGLSWNTVVAEEMVAPRSLVPASFPAYMRSQEEQQPGWCYATQETLEYYLDPRSWLDVQSVFMFELLSYNESYHTEAAVQSFLNNSFMRGMIPDAGMTYARCFLEAGKMYGVSPVHLASRVYQEQGVYGTSPLISGTHSCASCNGKYMGLYNFFNIEAAGTTRDQVIHSGLAEAKRYNWNRRDLAINGGAQLVSSKYISKGQDTLYLQKFDVDGSYYGMYWHQYMQNIVAPSSEGKNIYKMYNNSGNIDNVFVFKIPVYLNMPAKACHKPTEIPTVYEGVDYSPVYSYEYYRDNNQDVADYFQDDAKLLLEHFVLSGMSEGRQAKKDFNVYGYLDLNPDVADVFENDLAAAYLHYINFGMEEERPISGEKPLPTRYKGVSYAAVFNAEFYAKVNADIAGAFKSDYDKMLQHFVEFGMKEGRIASEEFDVFAYRDTYTDVADAFRDDLPSYYMHYIRCGKEEGRTAPYDPLDYSIVFDAQYYAENNKDVKAAFQDNEKLLKRHFIQCGMDEGRPASPDFDVKIYKAENGDLQAVFKNDYRAYFVHYIQYGHLENRVCKVEEDASDDDPTADDPSEDDSEDDDPLDDDDPDDDDSPEDNPSEDDPENDDLPEDEDEI